jgi:hypothetical protein
LEELECAFGVVGKIVRSSINGIYLVRFGFKMWKMLIFNSFLPLTVQINSKKQGFGREKWLRLW